MLRNVTQMLCGSYPIPILLLQPMKKLDHTEREAVIKISEISELAKVS